MTKKTTNLYEIGLRGAMDKARDSIIAGTAKTFGGEATQAQNRLSIRIIADKLMKRWLGYLAGQRYGGVKLAGDADDLRQFIEYYFGDETLAEVEPTITQIAGPPSGAQGQPPAGGGPAGPGGNGGPTGGGPNNAPTGGNPSSSPAGAPASGNPAGSGNPGQPQTPPQQAPAASQADPEQPPTGSTPEQVKAFHEQRKAFHEDALRKLSREIVAASQKSKNAANDPVIKQLEQQQQIHRNAVAQHQTSIDNPTATPAAAQPQAAQAPTGGTDPQDDGLTIPHVPGTKPINVPEVPGFLQKQRNHLAPQAKDDLSIPYKPGQEPVPTPAPRQTPAVPGFLQKQRSNLPRTQTFGQKGHSPYDAPTPVAPAKNYPFGRKGVTFGRKGLPTATAAPQQQASALSSVANDAHTKAGQLVSAVTDALSKTKTGTPARAQVEQYIRKLQADPHISAKFPQLADIHIPKDAWKHLRGESVISRGKLVEAAQLNRSQLDAIFRRLAAFEMKSGRAFTSNTLGQQAQGGGQGAPAGGNNGGNMRGGRNAPIHGFDANRLMLNVVTTQGLENAEQMMKNSGLRGAWSESDFKTLKDLINQEYRGSVNLHKLLSDGKLSHVTGKAIGILLYALAMSH